MKRVNNKKSVKICRSTFKEYDDFGDGKIHEKFIGVAVRAMGLDPTQSDLARCTAEIQPNERISFRTFKEIYQQLAKKRRDKSGMGEALIKHLRSFDPQGTGRISASIMRDILQGAGDSLSDAEIKQLLPNSSEEVKYEEFVRMVVNN